VSYIKPKLTQQEAEAVLSLLRRWHGSETARDRAEAKLELAMRSFIKALRR
jgi:hypothetical protein